MAELSSIIGADAIKAFQKFGFEVVRIKGSHHIMKKRDHPFLLSIPVHKGRTLGVGLIKRQIDAAGISVTEFIEALP